MNSTETLQYNYNVKKKNVKKCVFEIFRNQLVYFSIKNTGLLQAFCREFIFDKWLRVPMQMP